MEPIDVEQYVKCFIRALTGQLLEDTGIPCAFAVMTITPVGESRVRFNIVEGGTKELLPKGKDEVRAFLTKSLRMWEEINYPDKVPAGPEQVGHA